jgi:hypothetical protein
MYLKGTSDLIQITTGSAGDIEVHASWAVSTDGSPPTLASFDSEAYASITTATTTTIVSGVASSTVKLKTISIFNNHASVSNLVYCDNTDGTDTVVIAGSYCTLLPKESLVMTESGIWLHYDANGALYPAIGNAASQAEMEAGTATDKYVTPQGVNWHPGAAKCWGKANGTGTSLLVNWNVSGITDIGTGRLSVTIGTDFSSTHYAIVANIERGVTTYAEADVEQCTIRSASPAVGSFEVESYDHTATTLTVDDPSNYFWACFGDQ